MKLLDALKDESGIRVTCGWRWLVVDDDSDTFVVYERKQYAKKTKRIIETKDEDLAVNALVA